MYCRSRHSIWTVKLLATLFLVCLCVNWTDVTRAVMELFIIWVELKRVEEWSCFQVYFAKVLLLSDFIDCQPMFTILFAYSKSAIVISFLFCILCLDYIFSTLIFCSACTSNLSHSIIVVQVCLDRFVVSIELLDSRNKKSLQINVLLEIIIDQLFSARLVSMTCWRSTFAPSFHFV